MAIPYTPSQEFPSLPEATRIISDLAFADSVAVREANIFIDKLRGVAEAVSTLAIAARGLTGDGGVGVGAWFVVPARYSMFAAIPQGSSGFAEIQTRDCNTPGKLRVVSIPPTQILQLLGRHDERRWNSMGGFSHEVNVGGVSTSAFPFCKFTEPVQEGELYSTEARGRYFEALHYMSAILLGVVEGSIPHAPIDRKLSDPSPPVGRVVTPTSHRRPSRLPKLFK